ISTATTTNAPSSAITTTTVISIATTTNAASSATTTSSVFTSATSKTSTAISTATTTNAPSSAITTTTGLNPNASNITWLMSIIKASNQTTIISASPTFMAIDDQNYFVVLGYRGNVVQMNRTTMSVIRSANLAAFAGGFTYSNGYYFTLLEMRESTG
ncbi:unnamed protein product, partial [Didymodactylos carnosus]